MIASKLRALAGFALLLVLAASGMHAQSVGGKMFADGPDYPVVHRDRCATHFQLPDGTIRAVITIRPHNYQDATGNWHLIDETLRAGTEFAFTNLENGLTSRFPHDVSSGVSFEGHGQPVVTMQPVRFGSFTETSEPVLSWEPRSTAAEGQDAVTVHYPSLFHGVTDEYVIGADRVKHSLVVDRNALDSIETSARFGGEFRINVPEGFTVRQGRHGKTVRLVNEAGECIYEFGPVFAYDGADARVDGVLSTRIEGNSLVLGMTIDTAWALEDERQWPIRIDPTLALQPDGVAGKDAQMRDGAPTTNYGTHANISTNYSGNVTLEAYLQFDVSSIPAGGQVTNATFAAWHRSNTTTGHVWDINEALAVWDEMLINWTNRPAVDPNVADTLTHVVGSPGVWREHTGMAALTQLWVSGTNTNNGFRLKNMTNLNGHAYKRSSDDATVAERPKFTVDYTAGPMVSGAAPDPVKWGELLTITGTGMDNATVTIGNEPQVLTSNTPTQIELEVATTTPLGSQGIEVTTATGSDSSLFVVVDPALCVVSGATPDPADWLQTLTITGNLLSTATDISIGGVSQSVTAVSANSMDVTISDLTPTGAQDIVIANAAGNSVPVSVVINSVAPVVTGSTPTAGTWGQTLAIDGNYLAGTTSVEIGGVPQVITSAATTQVEVDVADGTPIGQQTVELTTPGGVSSSFSVDINGVQPAITLVAPATASWGQTVVVTGDFLASVSSLTIGGIDQTVTGASSSQIEFDVDYGTPTGAQTLEITTLGGVVNDTITVDPVPPAISAATPDPVEWLETLTISGVALGNATSVTLGGITLTPDSNTPLEIQVTVTVDVPVGPQTLEIVTAHGTDSIGVTVDGAAPITSALSSTTVLRGSSLTITGNALASASVAVGGTPATIESNTATEIVIRLAGATPTGSQPVEVTTPYGSASNLTVTVNNPVSDGSSGGDGCASEDGTSSAWLLLSLLALLAWSLPRRREA